MRSLKSATPRAVIPFNSLEALDDMFMFELDMSTTPDQIAQYEH